MAPKVGDINNVLHLHIGSVWYYRESIFSTNIYENITSSVRDKEKFKLNFIVFLPEQTKNERTRAKREPLAINSKEKYIQIFAFSVVFEFYRKRERFLFAGNDSHFVATSRFYEVISRFALSQASRVSVALSASISGKVTNNISIQGRKCLENIDFTSSELEDKISIGMWF